MFETLGSHSQQTIHMSMQNGSHLEVFACMTILWVWLGRGQCYPNFLLIRMVQNFPLGKGVRIVEVGL